MNVVFFDASVLFKAAVTRFLLGAERVGEFRVAWSPAVVEEARRNLVAADRPGALAAFEQNLAWPREPLSVVSRARVESQLRRTDPKDRHVLAAAAAAGAGALLTANAKDFDIAEAAALGTRIVTPDEFAVELAARNPVALIRYVERVPPERFNRYRRLLAAEMPTAMELLSPMFDE